MCWRTSRGRSSRVAMVELCRFSIRFAVQVIERELYQCKAEEVLFKAVVDCFERCNRWTGFNTNKVTRRVELSVNANGASSYSLPGR
jgi:hypothetical protein